MNKDKKEKELDFNEINARLSASWYVLFRSTEKIFKITYEARIDFIHIYIEYFFFKIYWLRVQGCFIIKKLFGNLSNELLKSSDI